MDQGHYSVRQLRHYCISPEMIKIQHYNCLARRLRMRAIDARCACFMDFVFMSVGRSIPVCPPTILVRVMFASLYLLSGWVRVAPVVEARPTPRNVNMALILQDRSPLLGLAMRNGASRCTRGQWLRCGDRLSVLPSALDLRVATPTLVSVQV